MLGVEPEQCHESILARPDKLHFVQGVYVEREATVPSNAAREAGIAKAGHPGLKRETEVHGGVKFSTSVIAC